jgi:prephenate dehydrogenase
MVIFNKICIIGIGLIGSSLLRVIKEKKICNEIIVIDNNKEYLNYIKNFNIKTYNKISKNITDIDLFILATPVNTFESITKQITKFAKKKSIIIDVGSVKNFVVNSIEKILKNKDIYFVGCHPIAGTEKSGPKNGLIDLFENKKCIITPTKKTSKEVLNKIEIFWKNIGMNVEFLTPKEHDKIFSIMSHIPHLIAFKYYDLAKKENALNFAGSGFNDFTRIAHSNKTMWKDIFFYNKDFIIKYLENFIRTLKNNNF